MTRIVGGVDDSPGALAALHWALGVARSRAATLEVVHAYDTHLPDVLHGGVGVEVLAIELTEHVSQPCLHHAECPVVIVPHTRAV